MSESRLPKDLTGLKFGKLTIVGAGEPAVEPSTGKLVKRWLASCECGGTSTVRRANLARGATRSCGCGTVKHRMHGTRTYSSWVAMRERCENPRYHSFFRYGGAGITVHPAWRDFTAFFRDMGERPPGTSIDRIDGSKGYEPGNCRWATLVEQAQNKKATRLDAKQRKQVAWMHRVRGYSSKWLASVYGVSNDLITLYSRRLARGEL